MPVTTMKAHLLVFICCVLYTFGARDWKNRPRLWGTNIHFTTSQRGEPEQIAQAYNVARMDLFWAVIEKTKGQYDFSAYETLLHSFKNTSPNVVCYWILDYANELYDGGNSPTSPQALQAFANFAHATVLHFAGNDIIWEMWNEPNLNFGKPVDPVGYYKLALAVGKAIKSDPRTQHETFVGPALAGFDLKYAEQIFAAGVLEYFDAVSVHPYRPGPPESVILDYATLRALIDRYNKRQEYIPILSGEWGYSTCVAPCYPGVGRNSEQTQAKYLARQWLINTLGDIPVSIWYDYHDDGSDPTEVEQNFGSVRFEYINESYPHVPKPSYNAAYTLSHVADVPYLTRIRDLKNDNETYILAFASTPSKIERYAIWKTSGVPNGCDPSNKQTDCGYAGITKQQCEDRRCCYQMPYIPPGPQCYGPQINTTATVQFQSNTGACFTTLDLYGLSGKRVCTQNSVVSVVAGDSPIYLKLEN